jgi:HD-GYP domain-containing protein (c-di-GMP phosphodiesterase class II)
MLDMTQQSIQLAELVSALSYALDLTEGQPAGHNVRACWMGVQIGRRLGMSTQALSDLYYTILLKDAGCSSNAARVCQLYVTDDLAFKGKAKMLDHSAPQFLRFLIANAGMRQSVADRFRTIVETALKTGQITRELTETRCHRGADIARRMRFSAAVTQGIVDLDEKWNGKGLPGGKHASEISLLARIALLSQVVDVFYMSEGRDKAIAEIRRRSGTWFDPRVVNAFVAVASADAFWTSLADPFLRQRVIELETLRESRPVDEDYLDDIAAAFAQVIDAKTPFTSGHSDRVAIFADLIAAEMYQSPEQRRQLHRAALLHDIGKLGVSNSILEKPGKLTDEEWDEIKRHPTLGELILSRVAAFADLAEVAGAHHERLDGTGYPKALRSRHISLDARIVAVADVFDALTADRPYRKAMSMDQAIAILDQESQTALDPRCVAALKRGLASLESAARAKAA